jgi:hypothetical protein
MSVRATDTQPDGADDLSPAASALPARTTPTWEMELLLSGATVFGLLQVPDQLDRFFMPWINASSAVLGNFVLALAVYAQFAVFVLAMTFVAHLCLRAYWVALVGVHSVLPAGARRDASRFGPHYLDTLRRREQPAAERIEAADNRATLVFAVGVGLALAMLAPMAVVLLAIGAIAAAVWLGLDPAPVRTGVFVVVALLALPLRLAIGIDRGRGARWAADSRGGRALRGLFDAYARIGLLRGRNALLDVFAGRLGARRGAWVLSAGIALAMMAVGLRMVGSGRGWFDGGFAALPADAPTSADNLFPRFYDSLRGDAPTLAPMPYINGPVVAGPYLQLFIPYRARRYDDLVRVRCAGARTDQARLACVSGLVTVRLDGVLLRLAPVAARDADNGQRGLLAMIPTAALAPGRHDLAIQPPRPLGEATAPLPYRIPFWK